MNISYRYIDPDMIFTNDREEVISSIQTGDGTARSARKCLVVNMDATDFSFQISRKREREKKPRSGFQGLNSLAERHSIMSLLILTAFRINCRSVFIPVKPGYSKNPGVRPE